MNYPNYESSPEDLAAQDLVEMSKWLDKANGHRHPETVTWGRLAKVSEECGEVVAAYIGYTGQNPRKGQTHTLTDVRKELFDVAITALGAIEHLDEHQGRSIRDLFTAIDQVAIRMRKAQLKDDPSYSTVRHSILKETYENLHGKESFND